MVVRDELLFPYLAGNDFTSVLKATSGWPDFGRVFANPPQSTQPDHASRLYLSGVTPGPDKRLSGFSTVGTRGLEAA